ncbi:MAG: RNA polymerase factor sigma-54 [Alphaproteobacteria bacterium]|nr:RNA polymerase factor sigma-54 [Alphaproteobacteria bacterium]
MAMMPRFELRQGQSQSLVMTPQLQQAIKLLQMSNLELTEYVEAELERNPLLEKSENLVEKRASDSVAADRESQPAAENASNSENGDAPDLAASLSDGGDSQSNVEQLDTGLENVYADEAAADLASRQQASTEAGWSSMGQGSSAPLGEDLNFEATLSRERTLAEHLTEQLNIALTDPVSRMIGVQMIGALNETGYLTASTEQIADTLGADIQDVEMVLATVQTFDPAGIFARDLSECLAVQLKEKDRLDPVMQTLLDNLELLAKHDFSELMKRCGADRDDLTQMIEDIRDCNPRPGSAYGSEVVQPVIPDVFVREAADGSWHVELNSETLPRVLVNNQYYANVSKGTTREEDKTYLTECLTDANWLVKSLDQRARTILKVSREIVRQQDSFLVHGVQHLRPLNLKTVAEAIEMHESTVSRVTSNKYMSTSRGIFELKYFFTSAIASSEGGEAHSAEAVRQRIREMIDNEEPKKILSDDKIVELLNEIGIDIARRTVAKYREALGIPSSVQRRRQKKIFA